MKIAVCGKGGVGKTFIAASLAHYYSQKGLAVIAIDADSSPNLALSLGVSSPDAARIVPVADNAELIRLKTGTEYSGVFRLTFTVDDIIRKYAVPTPAGPGLLVMGTVKAMGSGCTCPAHSVIKALMRHLVVERDEVVILDMEAGIEHLGRGTAEHVDCMLVVSDANRKSRETAAAVIRLARDSAISDIRLVGNRITNLREEEILRSYAAENSVPLAALVPYDPDVAEAGITGEPVRPSGAGALKVIIDLALGLADIAPRQRKTPGGTTS
ncbi:MAG: AAA family ATPase [Methanomicrobiales archaeon]|nr:AAA family ATPase [Methanomicrobiales archaeon]